VKGYNLNFLQSTYAICKLPSNAQFPKWVKESDLLGLIRTPHDLTIICLEKDIPDAITKEGGWYAFYIDEVLDFDLTGVLTSILNPLADAGIAVYTLSTYTTDYILIRRDKINIAGQVLTEAGFQVNWIS
jgi:hypothetical protein